MCSSQGCGDLLRLTFFSLVRTQKSLRKTLFLQSHLKGLGLMVLCVSVTELCLFCSLREAPTGSGRGQAGGCRRWDEHTAAVFVSTRGRHLFQRLTRRSRRRAGRQEQPWSKAVGHKHGRHPRRAGGMLMPTRGAGGQRERGDTCLVTRKLLLFLFVLLLGHLNCCLLLKMLEGVSAPL